MDPVQTHTEIRKQKNDKKKLFLLTLWHHHHHHLDHLNHYIETEN